MLGESYVTDRRLLQEVFDEMLSLSVRTGISLHSAELFGPLFDTIRRPFLVSVLGEVNVGKSALINALHGSYLCRVSDLPETKLPMWHRCGEEKAEVVIDDRWIDCRWPQSDWQHWQWLDFPGLTQQDKATRAEWMEWLTKSDVILMVVHHRNPWSALTWDFLSRLDPAQLSRVAIVVQACDEMERSDFSVLAEHVRELAKKRVDRDLPVFLVSSRVAFRGRDEGLDALSRTASGVEALTRWIESKIEQEPIRSAARQAFMHLLHEQLQQLEHHLSAEKMQIAARITDWERIEREMEQLFRATCQHQKQAQPQLKKEFAQRSELIASEFRTLLGVRSSLISLFIGRRISRQLDQLSHAAMTQAVAETVANDANWLLKQCEAHWHTESMKRREDRFFTSQSWRDVEELMMPARKHLIERMGQVAALSLGQLRIRASLVGSLHERSMGISWWLSIFLLFMIFAGVSGFFRISYLPAACSSIAAIVWGILVVYAQKTRREISSFYLERLLASDDDFLAALREPYENCMADFIQKYGEAWLPLRANIAQDDAEQQEKWQCLKNAQKALSRLAVR
jgi:GTPase Era involved in 16S rRNA processing